MKIFSFPPIVPYRPRTLILGSMPGTESLRRQQYYGHPRNAFWQIIGTLIGFDAELDYCRRLLIIKQHHIALWDVLEHCERRGSLDSAIRPASEKANLVAELLQSHHSIRTVLFNGKKAETTFKRHINPQLHGLHTAKIRYETLPSSSPANARLTVAEKCKSWQQAFAQA